MDGSGAALLHSDYLVLLAALRGMVIHHWVDDRTRVRAEIMRFIALVEHDRPRVMYCFKAPSMWRDRWLCWGDRSAHCIALSC